MTSQPKAQHFVHRAYLEGFQDPSLLRKRKRAIWLYIPGRTPIPQAPERLAKRNYYYCHHQNDQRQFLAEETLQKMEDAALPILIQFRKHGFTFTLQDRVTFAGYFALAHTRVPTFERFVNHLAALTSVVQVERIATDRVALEWAVAQNGKGGGQKDRRG